MLTKTHIEALKTSLDKLLSNSSEGTIAYIKCFSTDTVFELINNEKFKISGWEVYLVSNKEKFNNNFKINSDKAVDIRESKKNKVLFLVDPSNVGSGMDGIYSASREIKESEILERANKKVFEELKDKTIIDFLKECIRRAKRIGKSNTISPWQIFDFYSTCVDDSSNIGKNLTKIGLWPIEINKFLNDDIEVSAQMIEKLILDTGVNKTSKARIDSLLLENPSEEQKEELSTFLSDIFTGFWRDNLLKLKDKNILWINNLKPSFLSGNLMDIEILPWKENEKASPYTWSGLKNEEDSLVFLIDKASSKPKKLQVRWKSKPNDLKKNSVSYQVSIITGDNTELVTLNKNHTGKEYESCYFTINDFEEEERLAEEYENNEGKWEVQIQIKPIFDSRNNDDLEREIVRRTESFILTFGESDTKTKSSVGSIVRALIEEAIKHNKQDFEELCNSEFREDNKGYISYKAKKNIGRIFRPDLIKYIEEDWKQKNFTVGRWFINIREDGSISKHPTFIPFNSNDENFDKKINDVNSKMCEFVRKKISFMSTIYYQDEQVVNNYINTWTSAFEDFGKDFTLANTLEVRNLRNETIGLIVLPSHPILVAWHYAYDTLLYYTKYEENLDINHILDISKSIDGAYYPFLLPGIEKNTSFIFGDKLGFYCVAMIPENASEPQAIVSLLARALSNKIYQDDEKRGEIIITSIGQSLSSLLGKEIEKYSNLHKDYSILTINGIRSGDSKTITKALGYALKKDNSEPKKKENLQPNSYVESYRLNLYSTKDTSLTMSGKYLSEIAEKRRNGITVVDESDKWVLESFSKENISIPRLRLAKYPSIDKDIEDTNPKESSHISIIFDTFKTQLKMILIKEVEKNNTVLEGFGLFPNISKVYYSKSIPTWKTTIVGDPDGEKHPMNKLFTSRLIKIHNSILKSILSCYGYNKNEYWPVLVTEVTNIKNDYIKLLHNMSDWVITIDKNAGIEYFDSPKDNPEIYDTFVIDCVPEKNDIGTIQQITSTSQLEEIRILLEKTLNEMELSYSSRNCTFLLSNLKSISGQLAMRLSYDKRNVKEELIALSLFYSYCKNIDQLDYKDDLFDLKKGFLLPIDDTRDLLNFKILKNKEEVVSYTRSDMVYITIDNFKNCNLEFSFIEVKFRKLRANIDGELFSSILRQTSNTRKAWFSNYFSKKLTKFELVLNRKKLAKALQFYADKARRNDLSEDFYQKIVIGINKLYDPVYLIEEANCKERGYIFCPRFFEDLSNIYTDDSGNKIMLFGPQIIPDLLPKTIIPIEHIKSNFINTDDKENIESTNSIITDTLEQLNNDANIVLGKLVNKDEDISLKITIKGNPHLMIVGLPGMGKTTSILNICTQMFKNNIVPIVFSFHEDMEQSFKKNFDDVNVVDLETTGIGFNPMKVIKSTSKAWLDNVGMIRDIFKSIFPDLGDIMINNIRSTIKESYTELGYENRSDYENLPVPEFETFFKKLKGQPKQDQRIITRLEELHDYGFFRSSTSSSSILNATKPTIIALHRINNDMMQKALASFVLFNIYQNMFIRGEKNNITHTIIFDEAHKASKLSLIGTMAKESRKYGISFIVASQESKDFDSSIYSAIGNHLILKVNEPDAKVLAKNLVPYNEVSNVKSKLITLEKFHGMLFNGEKNYSIINLSSLS